MTTLFSTVRFRLSIIVLGFLAAGLLCSSSLVQAQDGGAGGDNEMPRYWEVHASLLTLGTTFVVLGYLSLWLKSIGRLESLGVSVPWGKRLARFWYKWHVALGVAGVAMVLGGIGWGYLMVQWAYGGPHLRLSHSWVGVGTGIAASAPLLLGYLTRHVKKGKRSIRWWHMILGFAGLAMLFIGLSTGFGMD